MAELLTEKEMERRQRDTMIVSDYQLMRRHFPAASTNRLIRVMVQESKWGVKVGQLRKILLRAGVISRVR